MPRIMVEILEGRSPDQKRALIKEISDAIVAAFKVPVQVVAVRVEDVKFTDLGNGNGNYLDFALYEGKAVYGGSGDPRITVFCTEGHSLEEKREAVKQISEKCVKILGVSLDEVKILINEAKKDQFAKGGKLLCDKSGN